jgi:hypothetical protein
VTHDEEAVVKVADGPMVAMELYRQAIEAAGIECRVMGESLTASFGTGIPGSVELWVKHDDAEKARAAIEQYEAEREK